MYVVGLVVDLVVDSVASQRTSTERTDGGG